MTVELYGQTFEAAEAVVLAHLFPLENRTDALGAKRWAAGMRMPYRWVTLVSNPADQFSTYPVIWINTLATTYTAAAHEALRTDRRMLLLVNDPDYPIVLPGSSQQVSLERCEITELAHEEPYAAESVATRFVSEYALTLSSVTA